MGGLDNVSYFKDDYIRVLEYLIVHAKNIEGYAGLKSIYKNMHEQFKAIDLIDMRMHVLLH